MKVFAILLMTVLLLAGCGGDDDADSSTTTSTEAGATGATGSDGASEEEADAGALTADDEAAVEDTIKTWLTEGGCDLMTDKFLEAQTFQDDPAEACETFEDGFSEPLYDADDIIVSDIKGDSEKASAIVSDEVSNIESDYELVNEDGQWKIDSAGF